MSDLLDRAQGALLGLAAGDASGYPAAYHRLTPAPGRRQLLWSQAAEMDAQHINKFPLPFSHAAPLSEATFSATDDAEQAALATAVLSAAVLGAAASVQRDPDAAALFAAWHQIVIPQAEVYWGSIADRSAILNALDGLAAPHTGRDNPHFYDDSSVARAVPVGIVYSGEPDRAAYVARALASITNDGVGSDAAAIMADAIARVTAGLPVQDAVAAAANRIDSSTWLGRKYLLAEEILARSGSVFEAIPEWNDEIANLEYNFGNIAAETLPLALIIARQSQSLGEALGYANLIPKQADTMPAMVGALLGAAGGTEAIPATWRERVELLRGVSVPSTSGVRLSDAAQQLIKLRTTLLG